MINKRKVLSILSALVIFNCLRPALALEKDSAILAIGALGAAVIYYNTVVARKIEIKEKVDQPIMNFANSPSILFQKASQILADAERLGLNRAEVAEKINRTLEQSGEDSLRINCSSSRFLNVCELKPASPVLARVLRSNSSTEVATKDLPKKTAVQRSASISIPAASSVKEAPASVKCKSYPIDLSKAMDYSICSGWSSWKSYLPSCLKRLF